MTCFRNFTFVIASSPPIVSSILSSLLTTPGYSTQTSLDFSIFASMIFQTVILFILQFPNTILICCAYQNAGSKDSEQRCLENGILKRNDHQIFFRHVCKVYIRNCKYILEQKLSKNQPFYSCYICHQFGMESIEQNLSDIILISPFIPHLLFSRNITLRMRYVWVKS